MSQKTLTHVQQKKITE